MRYIVKKTSDATKKLTSNNTYLNLKNICKTKDKSMITDTIYRDSYDTKDGRRSYVEDKLAISYKYKCAYCERICKADIEHYRPKKKVTDEVHDGYYWLCYEWTNLIPSCITCNRDGAKHNLFPIIGTRVKEHSEFYDGNLDLEKFKANNSPLINEVPYLLHPEVDNPENYFEFEIDSNNEGIRIKGIDEDGRGNKTIEICKLNRLEIKLERKVNVIDDFISIVQSRFFKHSEDENDNLLFDSLEEDITLLKLKSLKEENTHTLLRKYIVKNSKCFEKILIPFLLEEQKKIMIQIARKVL